MTIKDFKGRATKKYMNLKNKKKIEANKNLYLTESFQESRSHEYRII